MSKKMEEEGHVKTDEDVLQDHGEDMRFVCPVCKRVLHEDNLVDVRSVVEDNLYFVGGVLIVGKVRLHCEFEHRFNEAEVSIDEPHKLMAVVDAEFDGSGGCVHFEIRKILAG